MPDGDSFLPRILSVFYAVFDVKQGPKIVCQVPEGLINTVSSFNMPGASVPPTPSIETSPSVSATVPASTGNSLTRNSSSSQVSPTDIYRLGGRHLASSQKRSISSQRTLFNFNDISMFVIPHPALCGRLVTCSTIRHRIIGFPVELNSGRYRRNYFRFNLCFVFDREADLSCYEPVVRKVSRVLKACEEESSFLSSPQSSHTVYAILEQLYEDLNSYSETSIPIDQFNSIELKLFPFYPNPPPVRDWMVPLALVNLSKRFEDNWDLTVLKVCKFVDGVNHVSRIAFLADCDLALTRQAISHLLYYQVIMMIDIFQYSNMYTLCKSVQWLADENHVKEECGSYVTKSGKDIPDWPKLLYLYSRLKPGKTVYDWMETYDVESLGIDIRRFTSFGVIKGFLQRVHRYPVYLPRDPSDVSNEQPFHPSESPIELPLDGFSRKHGKTNSNPNMRLPSNNSAQANSPRFQNAQGTPFPTTSIEKISRDAEGPLLLVQPVTISASHRARRASAAEKVLEQLRSRDIQRTAAATVANVHPNGRASWISFQRDNHLPPPGTAADNTPRGSTNMMTSTPTLTGANATNNPSKSAGSRRQSLINPVVQPESSPKAAITSAHPQRIARSPSTPHISQSTPRQAAHLTVPPGLKTLLDGEHHSDELCVRFQAGWSMLEKWLRIIGESENDEDHGRVVIIYR